MNIMASMMLTYSWLTFIHMPLFTKRAVICTQTSTSHTKFSIQKDQVPLPCVDVFCVATCDVLTDSSYLLRSVNYDQLP